MNRRAGIIADQEAKVADLRKKADDAARLVEVEEAVLRGMRLMAREPAGHLIPAALESKSVSLISPRANRRGRQPGAISHEWRDTLGTLYRESPDQFSITEAIAAALTNGLHHVRSKEVEDRMRVYLDHGYVERAGSGFRVSELAAQKYGFRRRQTQEAPTAVAEGASK